MYVLVHKGGVVVNKHILCSPSLRWCTNGRFVHKPGVGAQSAPSYTKGILVNCTRFLVDNIYWDSGQCIILGWYTMCFFVHKQTFIVNKCTLGSPTGHWWTNVFLVHKSGLGAQSAPSCTKGILVNCMRFLVDYIYRDSGQCIILGWYTMCFFVHKQTFIVNKCTLGSPTGHWWTNVFLVHKHALGAHRRFFVHE